MLYIIKVIILNCYMYKVFCISLWLTTKQNLTVDSHKIKRMESKYTTWKIFNSQRKTREEEKNKETLKFQKTITWQY